MNKSATILVVAVLIAPPEISNKFLVNGQVLENVLSVLLYDISIVFVVALETETATVPVLIHRLIVASKRFTHPIFASESKRVFNLITA